MSRRRANHLDHLLYHLALWTLGPLYVVRQALGGRNAGLLRQRLGLGGDTPLVRPLWFHAASVGEVNALAPLLTLIRERIPALPLLVTTATPTGADALRRRFGEAVAHRYLPLDLPGAVGRFLRRHRPRCAVMVETELWPHLYRTCREAELPLFIVNGRVSPRTLEAPRWLCRLYREALGAVTAVLARSAADRDGFIALGAIPERVEVVGNIKFAAAMPQAAEPIDLGRPYLLAASTREGEELLLAEAWADSGDILLVIAPRHPQRREQILAALTPLGGPMAVRSRGELPGPETRLYLADTFGELGGFMAGAECVVMGGSLVPRGGQNLLEPAALGRPVLFGPHMENFADEARLLLEASGAVQAADAAALVAEVRRLLADPATRAALGENARAAVAARADMAERYLAALAAHCPELGQALAAGKT